MANRSLDHLDLVPDSAGEIWIFHFYQVPRGANVIVEGRLVEDSTPGLFVLEARRPSRPVTARGASKISKAHVTSMVFHFGHSPGGKIGSMEDRQVVAR